jgi:ABC-type oligopeptide transport system ATPase subunit
MGPSGSGKSTLLNLIAGLDKPTSGEVTVAGERVDRMGETGVARFRRREIGMVFQFFNLLEDLTVQDNVLLPAQLAGVRRGDARARAAELLAKLAIERYRDSRGGTDARAGDPQPGSGCQVRKADSAARRRAGRERHFGRRRPMSGVAVIRAASGGALRRVVQSVVVLGVLAFSTVAALLALAVLTSANQGFTNAFANEHEPERAVMINSAKVTNAQLAKARRLNGVTATAGPYPETTITATTGSTATAGHVGDSQSGPHKGTATGASAPASASAGARPSRRGVKVAGGGSASRTGSATRFTVVGRASPFGELHHVAYNPSIMDAITHGQSRWPSALGEISIAQATSIRVPLGDTITITSAPVSRS